MKKLNIAILALIINCNIMAQKNEVEVPEGVIYNKTSERINLEAKELLIKELNSPEYCLFDKIVYCGPNIWYRYKDIPPLNEIKEGDIKFEVPQNDDVYQAIGKLIQSKNNFIKLWDQVILDFKDVQYTIRKLNKEELKYHWSIIFYDIQEPIFILENDNHQFIIDFNENLKIIWIEEILK